MTSCTTFFLYGTSGQCDEDLPLSWFLNLLYRHLVGLYTRQHKHRENVEIQAHDICVRKTEDSTRLGRLSHIRKLSCTTTESKSYSSNSMNLPYRLDSKGF
jgi:hypothetical protein